MPRGGRRPGAGAPRKTPMSAEEFELVKQIRAKGKGRHGAGWSAAAQAVNARRVAGALDPRTVSARSVSWKWVQREFDRLNADAIRLQNQSNSVGEAAVQTESDGASHTGTRTGYESTGGD